MNSNTIFEKFQSGFRSHQSTETGLLRVTNNLLVAADAGDCSVLILMDLSAAFDMVDHSILFSLLKKWVGIPDSTLCCFQSYLSHKTSHHTCGVPQGSVLGPLLFSIYMLTVWDITTLLLSCRRHSAVGSLLQFQHFLQSLKTHLYRQAIPAFNLYLLCTWMQVDTVYNLTRCSSVPAQWNMHSTEILG